MELTRIEALLIGRPAPLGDSGAISAIARRSVERAWLGPTGLLGDEPADTRHHGGPDKALHHYSLDHYPAWQAEIGPRAVFEAPGAFGENLATRDLTEADLCLGDRVRCGGAVIELAQLRQPCWKLKLRFGQADMPQRVQATGRSGWYWRVVESGWIAAGDALQLIARPYPDWPLTRVWRALYVAPLDRAELEALARLAPLAAGHRELFSRRLDTGQIEDWARRLDGSV